MEIGLISDTHGLLRPEAAGALQGVDLILHGGDIGSRSVLQVLNAIAAVHVVRGNNDSVVDWADVPQYWTGNCGGISILMIHELPDITTEMLASKPQIVVYGHSHKPASFSKDGIHYINPGAAGPKRFSLPISVARLQVTAGKWDLTFINLLDQRPLP